MSYIKGKVYGYGDWTPQQINDLILLAYQLRQAEVHSDWTTDVPAMISAVDGITTLLDTVGAANE